MRKTTTEEMQRLTPEAYHEAPKLPLVVILDNVRSQHNIGAVFRTADAFRLNSIYLCGICSCPPNQEIHKTALGAETTVDWKYKQNTLDAVLELQQQGYTVYAVEQAHGATMLNDFRITPKQKIAIILGHEVFGVQQTVIDAANGCIEIPQYGTKHSLNVSVTAGIVIYNLATLLRNLQP